VSTRGAEGAGLTRGERVAIFVRSLLLQSAWNTRDMQNVGFCFSMMPVAGRLEGDRTALAGFLGRHLAFFNTNPALSTFAISQAAEAEVTGRPQDALEIKRTLSGPLGMAGDALLWGTLRPLAAMLAVAAFLMGVRWAPVLLVVFYALPQLILRASGAAARGAHGEGARPVFGPGLRRLTTCARAALSFLAGAVVALSLGSEALAPQTLAIAGCYFALAFLALRARVPATLIGLAGVAGGVALMYTRF